jgi:hypothetical protein
MSKLDRRFVERFDALYAGCLATWSTRTLPVVVRRHPCGDVGYHWIARRAKLSADKAYVYTRRFNSCLFHDTDDYHVFERAEGGGLIWHALDTIVRGKRLRSTFSTEVERERARAIIGGTDLLGL